MLQITIPAIELWDEQKEIFINRKEQKLQLEHSLVSLSKWESKWRKPFLSTKHMTEEEVLDYIKCMTITQNVGSDVYDYLSDDNIREIKEYIEAPQTATTFSEDDGSKGGREIVTAELIYYWMIALNIPPEYQKWHLNRLITLIRVCNVKNTPPKKRGRKEMTSRYAALNEARRKRFNSKG